MARHHPGVLDPAAAEAEQIQARLHRDDVALLERILGRLTKRRFLVDVESDAVTCAVVHPRHPIRSFETLARGAVAAIDEHLADSEVRILAADSCCDRLDA